MFLNIENAIFDINKMNPEGRLAIFGVILIMLAWFIYSDFKGGPPDSNGSQC